MLCLYVACVFTQYPSLIRVLKCTRKGKKTQLREAFLAHVWFSGFFSTFMSNHLSSRDLRTTPWPRALFFVVRRTTGTKRYQHSGATYQTQLRFFKYRLPSLFHVPSNHGRIGRANTSFFFFFHPLLRISKFQSTRDSSIFRATYTGHRRNNIIYCFPILILMKLEYRAFIILMFSRPVATSTRADFAYHNAIDAKLLLAIFSALYIIKMIFKRLRLPSKQMCARGGFTNRWSQVARAVDYRSWISLSREIYISSRDWHVIEIFDPVLDDESGEVLAPCVFSHFPR